jgi:protein tyrosine phosphatase (PTP) superfamily phosphohydrolase (DUF442 family)
VRTGKGFPKETDRMTRMHDTAALSITTRWWRVALFVVLLAAGGALLWTKVLRDRWIPKRWGVVEAGLVYRSGQLSRHLVEHQLRENGIRIVVDLMGDDPDNSEQPFERSAIDKLGIELHKCPLVGDGTGDWREYARAVEAIVRARDSGRPVLVHCYAGSQRTGGTVALYRLLVRRDDPREVLEELPRYAWRPDRDRVLLEYLDAHLPEITRELIARGVIERGIAAPSLTRLWYGEPPTLAFRDGRAVR